MTRVVLDVLRPLPPPSPQERLQELKSTLHQMDLDYAHSETMSNVAGLGDPAIYSGQADIEREIQTIEAELALVTLSAPAKVLSWGEWVQKVWAEAMEGHGV